MKTTSHTMTAIIRTAFVAVVLLCMLVISGTASAQEWYDYSYDGYASAGDAYSYASYDDYSYDYSSYGSAGDAYSYNDLYSGNFYSYDYDNYVSAGDTGSYTTPNYDYNYDTYASAGDAYSYEDLYNGTFYTYDNYASAGDTGSYTTPNYDYNYDTYASAGDSYSYNDLYSGNFYEVDAGGDTSSSAVTPDHSYENLYTGNFYEVDAGGDTYSEVDTPDYSYEQLYSGNFYEVDAGGDTYYEYGVGGDYVYYEEEYDPIYAYADSYDYYETDYYSPSYTYGGYNGGHTYHYSYDYDDCDYSCDHDRPKVKPTCTLTAQPDSIDDGDTVTLAWTTDNATSVSINYSIGNVAKDGSKTVSPDSSRIYILTATGPGGTVRCSEPVTVDEDEDVSCDSFTVSDSSVEEGDEVTLRWNTTHADDVSINNGVGDVDEDGSERVTIDDDTTFTLTARNGSDTDSCRVTVRVDEDDNEDVSCDSFTVSDSSVEEGDYVTLRWKTTNADDVSINQGIGDVDEDGDERVRVTGDTTFTLTAENNDDEDTCRVTVRVDEDDDNNTKAPRCQFHVSDTTVAAGEDVILSWENERTERLILRDSTGNVLADSKKDSRINEREDSLTVRPQQSTTYTLTVENDDRDEETCTLSVKIGEVAGAHISLSQVPYTGFEAGPVLTTIFYIALALWGIAVAYALVLKKKGSTTREVKEERVQEEVAPAQREREVGFAPSNLPTGEEERTSVDGQILKMLEEQAHRQYVLISSDALRLIAESDGTEADWSATLDRVIALAKARYPKEGDWVVLNKEKVLAVLS